MRAVSVYYGYARSPNVRFIRFSPDSTRIAFESVLDRDTVMLDMEQGHVIASSCELSRGYVSSLVFTLDGLYHVVAETAWNVGNHISVRKLLDMDGVHPTCDPLVLRCFERSVKYPSIAYSRNSSRIVSCFDNETIRVWHVLDPPLSNRCNNSANALSKWALDDDGWIVVQNDNKKRDLLVWVPHDLRRTLCQARNTTVLNRKFFTKLDFLGAALGDRWSECLAPSYRESLG